MAYGLTLGGAGGAALVIGGSGGAGSAIAMALAQAGSAVALSYNSYPGRAAEAAEAIERLGSLASTWAIDLTDPNNVAQAVAAVAERHGGVHTLVHAAGPIFPWGPIGETDTRELHRCLLIEAEGFHAAVRAALPHLRAARGSIVACTTWATRRVMIGDGLSAVPKAAVEAMVRQIAREEAEHLVRANIVALGSVGIGMASVENERNMVAGISEEQWAQMLAQIPLGQRLGKGEEVASAVLYLASDQAAYVTGQTIVVDGGLSL